MRKSTARFKQGFIGSPASERLPELAAGSQRMRLGERETTRAAMTAHATIREILLTAYDRGCR